MINIKAKEKKIMLKNMCIDLEDLNLAVPTYEDWLKEGGEKQKADKFITEYAKKYQLYKLCDADQTEYDYSGYLVKAEPAEFTEIFKKSLRYEPLGAIYTGNKHATYVSGCGWYYETLADVISNELGDDFGHVLYQHNKKNFKDAGMTEDDFTCGDYNLEISEISESWEYPHKLIESYSASEVLKLLVEKDA